MEMPRLAKRAARESGMQLMVHIGDTEKRYDPKVIRSLLPLLEPGDILTHYFTANPGGVLDGNGKLVPEAREAVGSRRVVRHRARPHELQLRRRPPRASTRACCPHCISTDLTVPGRIKTVHSMTEMMTRFLGLGFTLAQVVTMCTANPAKAIGAQERLGQPGGRAAGRHLGARASATATGWSTTSWASGLRVEPRGGPLAPDGQARPRVHAGLRGPRPWGWLPDRAVAGGCC